MSLKLKLIINLITLTVTTLLLVFTVLAWYVTNSRVTVDGVTGVTANSNYVHFKENVIAKKTSLTNSVTTYTYNIRSDGALILRKVEYDDGETPTENYTMEQEKKFEIAELLPGEYVDITIGYYMDSQMNGKSYSIRLNNIHGDNFTVDNVSHSAAGAFKYKSVSLKDEANKAVDNYNVSGYTPDATYTWFDVYRNRIPDSYSSSIDTLNHTWNSTYVALYYTFRISEDFTQYYRLIGQAEEAVGRLLSNTNFYIGHIFVVV